MLKGALIVLLSTLKFNKLEDEPNLMNDLVLNGVKSYAKNTESPLAISNKTALKNLEMTLNSYSEPSSCEGNLDSSSCGTFMIPLKHCESSDIKQQKHKKKSKKCKKKKK